MHYPRLGDTNIKRLQAVKATQNREDDRISLEWKQQQTEPLLF